MCPEVTNGYGSVGLPRSGSDIDQKNQNKSIRLLFAVRIPSLDAAFSNNPHYKISNEMLISDWYWHRLILKAEISISNWKWKRSIGTALLFWPSTAMWYWYISFQHSQCSASILNTSFFAKKGQNNLKLNSSNQDILIMSFLVCVTGSNLITRHAVGQGDTQRWSAWGVVHLSITVNSLTKGKVPMSEHGRNDKTRRCRSKSGGECEPHRASAYQHEPLPQRDNRLYGIKQQLNTER